MRTFVKLLLPFSFVLLIIACSDDEPANNDNSNLPVLTISDTTVREGGSAVFILHLSAPSDKVVTYKSKTEDGTATSIDYFSSTETEGTINPGIMTSTITVKTIVDNEADTPETFKLVLSSPSNARLDGETKATCTIE
jgi:endoglucanase